ncbi:MAG: nickel pincer cofactor biosynthesis protein LarC [Candidatus Eisenbacteria bacterium]|nr:nickel pincer cofactor biosynthesis protein LarC [Candidatus Eisenbacteria bacterium]
MIRRLHLEQVGGVSGDMLLGALIGLGIDPREMEQALRGLGLPELTLVATSVERNGAPATRVEVLADGRPAEDHQPGANQAHHHDHPREHPHEHGHDHPHEHGHDHPHEHGPHLRRLPDIVRLVEGSDLPAEVRSQALAIFRRLAEAEAEVHGTGIDQVHFHEVGALDSIADVVGAAWGFHRLGIDRVTTGPFVLGRGEVQMAHGNWPVPAPATLVLLAGAPVRFVNLIGETVTPTGAAILVTLAEPVLDLPVMTLERVAAGAGRREWPDRPNILRAFLGSAAPETTAIQAAATAGVLPPISGAIVESVALLATQVDDMTPQAIADLMTRLLAAGALDVLVTPGLMKKGRPGFALEVVCQPADEGRLATLMFQHSSTLGVRLGREWRYALERRVVSIETPLGEARVKFTRRPGKPGEAIPEFDDCQKISQLTGKSLQHVMETVRRAGQIALESGRLSL